MRRGRRLTWSDRGLTPANTSRLYLATRTREKNARVSGISGGKNSAPGLESRNLRIPGALSGLNAQGLLHTEQRAKSNSRNAFEEVYICAREPRGSNVRSRKLLTAERCDRPVAVKANEDLRILARRPVWKPDAGRYGGQGALNRPEWFRGCVHTQHVVELSRR